MESTESRVVSGQWQVASKCSRSTGPLPPATGHRFWLAGLLLVLAGGLGIACPGCDDRAAQDQHAEDQKELTALRKERDDLLAKAKLAADRADVERKSLLAQCNNQVAAGAEKEEAFGRQLDQIRTAVDAALAGTGRSTPLASDDRTSVAKLVDEFIKKFAEVNRDYHSLESKCQDLQDNVDALKDTLRRVTSAAGSAPPATRSETPSLLPQP